MSDRLSKMEYIAEFSGAKRAEALKHALDIRKFEIDLYWKRAAYFWTFIGATFAGYGAVQVAAVPFRTDLSVFLSCLGLVFAFGWFCVNKGSKQWQENWENHVDLLEDDVIGPLYKIVVRRPDPIGLKQNIGRWIAGPEPFSVSRINQIISLFVTVLWFFLLCRSLPGFSVSAPLNWEYLLIIGATFLSWAGCLTVGKTELGAYRHVPRRRQSEIYPPT